MTNMKNLKVGMKVRIKVGCPATKKWHGYTESMARLEGTCTTIQSVKEDKVSLDGSVYIWHPDDIQIAGVKKKKETLELLFNPEELV